MHFMFCIQYLTLLWMVFFESVRAPTVQRRGKVGAKVVHRRCKAIWTHTIQSNVSLLVHLFCTSGADKAHAPTVMHLCVQCIFVSSAHTMLCIEDALHAPCKALCKTKIFVLMAYKLNKGYEILVFVCIMHLIHCSKTKVQKSSLSKQKNGMEEYIMRAPLPAPVSFGFPCSSRCAQCTFIPLH